MSSLLPVSDAVHLAGHGVGSDQVTDLALEAGFGVFT